MTTTAPVAAADARLWAAAYLALPTRVKFATRPVEERTEPDGRVWRESFAITVKPGDWFTIHLFAGASSADLKRAQEVVRRAQAFGLDYGDRAKARLWRQRGRGDWIYRAWHLTEREHYDELRECADAVCVKQWHEWRGGEQDEPCELEPIVGDYYQVDGYRLGGEWEASASVFTDPDVGRAGLRAIRDLENDYAWMQAECECLNNTAQDRSGQLAHFEARRAV